MDTEDKTSGQEEGWSSTRCLKETRTASHRLTTREIGHKGRNTEEDTPNVPWVCEGDVNEVRENIIMSLKEGGPDRESSSGRGRGH